MRGWRGCYWRKGLTSMEEIALMVRRYDWRLRADMKPWYDCCWRKGRMSTEECSPVLVFRHHYMRQPSKVMKQLYACYWKTGRMSTRETVIRRRQHYTWQRLVDMGLWCNCCWRREQMSIGRIKMEEQHYMQQLRVEIWKWYSY